MSALPCSGDDAMLAPGDVRSLPAGPTRVARAGAALVVAAAMLAGCGVGRDQGSSGDRVDAALQDRQEVYAEVTFDRIDQRLDDRVAAAGLSGAAIVVEPAAGQEHVHAVGDVGLTTPVPLGESSTWPTTAVLLSLVDDGTLELDEPIGPTLPWMQGAAAAITLRQLLSHTSGLPVSVSCPEPTTTACDGAVGAAALVAAPGEAFQVTDLDAHVAARLAETATARPWSELFRERLAGPTGMTVTAYAEPATTGGLLAVDGTTTPQDLGRFLAMIRDGGRAGEAQVLSPESVREMLVDQTVRLDTHSEPWVAETGVPTYGLGVWRDRLRGDDIASVVSAPNRYGLYPFVDVGRSAWGIVVVDDRTSRRADAVGESAQLTQLTAAALRRSPD